MSMKKAKLTYRILMAAAVVMLVWQTLASSQEGGFGWQGIAAIVLCIAGIAVHFMWVKCPHCGKPVARGAGKRCAYCGKAYEE